MTSKHEYSIVPATDEHILSVARNMRMEDRREVWASDKLGPHRALLRCRQPRSVVHAGTVDGQAICLFGVVPYRTVSTTGIVWMLATPELEKHAAAFARRNKGWLRIALQHYDKLVNVVDKRNENAIKWLKWLGAKFGKPIRHGPFDAIFLPFTIERDNV